MTNLTTTPEEEEGANHGTVLGGASLAPDGRTASARFFEIAGRAAKKEDGEESLMDRVMLSSASHSQQSNPVVRLLQSMVTCDDDDDMDDGSAVDDSRRIITPENKKPNSVLLKSIRSDDDLLGPEAEAFIRRLIAQEFPSTMVPTLANLINVGPGRTKSQYKPGEWVELLGQDMSYRLEMITRVIKIAPPDWDWNNPDNEGKDPPWTYYYHAGDKRMIVAEEVRSPKMGLVRIFGHRPWIWQQWACIKLEHTLRFQQGHQNDFMSKDITKYASDLWDKWLHNPKNADFRALFYDDRVGDRGRYELVNHIMSPFGLMDRMKGNKDWNFAEESRFSVFTYLGLLGSGYIIPLAIMGMQIAIPGVLIWNLLESSEEARASKECANLSLIGYSSSCRINPVAQAMAFVVLVFYMFKVVPDTLINFYETAGTGKSLYSRLISLRRDIWFRGDDRPEQVVGFRMDIYMNTGYVNILYMLNMFLIINTDDAFEILLNALAFEFVINLDEAFVKSAWWDPDRRWIMAASIELVLQSVILKSILTNVKPFTEKFKMSRESVLAAVDGDANLFKNNTVATNDQEITKFMTNDEIVKFLCLKVALETNNRQAIDEYQKPNVFFGVLLKSIKWLTQKGGGIFDRYGPYRTWSRWEKIIYAAPIPDLGESLERKSGGYTVVRPELVLITPESDGPFENLDQDYLEGKTDWVIFCYYYLEVITFQYLFYFCRQVWAKKRYFNVLLRAIDGLLHWISFLLQILFPLYTSMCLLGVAINMAGLSTAHPVL